MFNISKRLNKLLACFLTALLLMSNTVALVPVYAAASANTSEQISELPEITLDKQVEDQFQNKQNANTAHLSTKQKVVQFINQLIPYYAQNGKQQGPEWLRTTAINLTFTEDFKPIYSLETLQPFTKEVTDGKLGFWQGRYAYQSGANSTANLGVGLRWLSEDKTSIKGVNAFYDYAFKHDLSRVGFGAEYFNKQAEYRANFYIPTSGDRQTGATALADGILYSYIRAVSGFDYEVGTSLPNVPWLSLYASGFHYDNKYKADENGYRLRSKMQLTPRLAMEMGYTNSNLNSGSLYGKVLYQLADTAGPALRGGGAKEQSHDISHKLLQKVQRENEIKTETFTKFVAYTGSLSVTVTNSTGIALQGAQVQAYQNGSPVGAVATTDASGTAVLSGLAAGEYTVRAAYFSVSDDSAVVTVVKDQTTTVPAIALAVVGGKALIHVMDNAGTGVGGATVTAEAASGLHGAADKSFFDRILGVKTAYAAAAFTVTAVTDASGIATFTNLPPGNYKFTVTYSGKEMKSLSVAVADGSTSNSTVVLPASGGNIVAMIIDAVSKAVINGAAVELKSGSTVIDTKATGNDGTAVFSGLTAGANYTVTGKAVNYSDKSISTTVTDKETVAAEIALTPLTPQTGGATITVQEYYPGNALLSGATVSITVNGQVITKTTGADGTATFTDIPPGSYYCKITKRGYTSSETFGLWVVGGEITPLTVDLSQSGSMTVTVQDENTAAKLNDATVTVTVGAVTKTATTDGNGQAILTDVRVGTWNLSVKKAGYSDKSQSITISQSNNTEATITLTPQKGSATITVQDEDTAEKLSGETVTVTVGAVTKTATTDGNGQAKFINLPVGTWNFSVKKAGYNDKSQSVTISKDNNTEATITLAKKMITAQVNVKDGAGKDVSWDANVRVTGNGVDQTKRIDASGNATFSLPAGTYTFAATYIYDGYYTNDSKTILLSDETSSVNLTIVRKIGSLTLIVKDQSNGQPISGAEITKSYTSDILGYTGTDGKLTLNDVPTGIHAYTASKDGYQGMIYSAVTVNEGTNEQVIELPRLPGKARVTVKSGATTLPGATVTLADGSSKNTNVYGRAIFESVPSGEVVFSASMSGYASQTVTATIAPGDAYTDVEINLSAV